MVPERRAHSSECLKTRCNPVTHLHCTLYPVLILYHLILSHGGRTLAKTLAVLHAALDAIAGRISWSAKERARCSVSKGVRATEVHDVRSRSGRVCSGSPTHSLL